MSHQDRFNVSPRLNVLPQNPEMPSNEAVVNPGRFPSWLHRKLPKGDALWDTHKVINANSLQTVCVEAKCPNLLECYSKKTATFLVMGKECTRSCGFCDIDFTKTPKPLDDEEPSRVASSAIELGLSHIVITMVARDDLADGGAQHMVRVVQACRQKSPHITCETLTSDFSGNKASLDIVMKEAPEIFNHNLETVRRLTPQVRHKATYDRSLEVLSYVKKQSKNILIKSGIMIGLGETKDEVIQALKDLHDAGCDIVTIGQYLQASHKKLIVKEFVHPAVFKEYEEAGRALGIKNVYSAPFVRSSYNAHLFVQRGSQTITINSH